ncbi:MAG: hypothetical protein JSV66_06825 [Trueperaceae bacterium]|nr:MAG: hypothetical protein JSV66_06825 [Trueperaceae bacterium]
MRRVTGVFIVLAAVAWCQPESLIITGRFADAYHQAVAIQTAESQALAAQAASYQAVYLSVDAEEKGRWLERAVVAAEQAMELDSTMVGGHFELARAVGQQAVFRGIVENLGTAKMVRELFDTCLELDPDLMEVKVALGQWHLELSQRGVGSLYGAKRELALPLIAEGVRAEPERIDFRVEYATALLRTGDVAGARDHLEIALGLPVRTAVDVFEQERARRLIAGL